MPAEMSSWPNGNVPGVYYYSLPLPLRSYRDYNSRPYLQPAHSYSHYYTHNDILSYLPAVPCLSTLSNISTHSNTNVYTPPMAVGTSLALVGEKVGIKAK